MKIRYEYSQEHKEMFSMIEARILELEKQHYASVCRVLGKHGGDSSSLSYRFAEPRVPYELTHLREQLVYLKGCIQPERIIITERNNGNDPKGL